MQTKKVPVVHHWAMTRLSLFSGWPTKDWKQTWPGEAPREGHCRPQSTLIDTFIQVPQHIIPNYQLLSVVNRGGTWPLTSNDHPFSWPLRSPFALRDSAHGVDTQRGLHASQREVSVAVGYECEEMACVNTAFFVTRMYSRYVVTRKRNREGMQKSTFILELSLMSLSPISPIAASEANIVRWELDQVCQKCLRSCCQCVEKLVSFMEITTHMLGSVQFGK